MSYNYLPKKKRAVYEKEFTFNHVLQNLQGYRLATGDVNPHELSEKRHIHGDDEGKLYGSLITGAGVITPLTDSSRKSIGSTDNPIRRKSRKRRRNERKTQTSDGDRATLHKTTSSGSDLLQDTSECGGPTEAEGETPDRRKNIEEGVLVKKKDISERRSKEQMSFRNTLEQTGAPITGTSLKMSSHSSLDLIATYSDSESCDSDSSVAMSRSSVAMSRSNVMSGGGGRTEHRDMLYSIPSVIQTMFGEKGEKEANPVCNIARRDFDDDDDDNLGYFEPADSSSMDSNGDDVEDKVPAVSKKWSEEKGQWVFGSSMLSSYTCWKCSNVGHLPQDCTVAIEGRAGVKIPGKKTKISQSLQSLYATCRGIRAKKGQRCAECGIHSNLAFCLDCRSIFCDGRGHLASHLVEHPSHNTLYSFKIGRLIKCCKSTCEVTNVYDLLMCSHCLGKAFSQHYSLINATWSVAGLRKIPNALCCDEHFQWHRMNCSSVSEDHFIDDQKLCFQSSSDGLLSEFFF